MTQPMAAMELMRTLRRDPGEQRKLPPGTAKRILAFAGPYRRDMTVFLAATVLTWAIGGWWPDPVLVPTLGLMLGVAIIAALSLAGSVFLSATANGIAVFMVFGAGLVAGLLGQIGEALSSGTLQDVSTAASWLLPFEGLYQAGLSGLTADTIGFTRFAIDLGPFGGAQSAGPGLWLWAVVYLGLVGAWALRGFTRRDL